MIVFLWITGGIAMFVGGILVAILATKRNSGNNRLMFFENAKDRDGTIFMLLCFIAILILVSWFRNIIDDNMLSFILGNLVNGFILIGKSAIDSKIEKNGS